MCLLATYFTPLSLTFHFSLPVASSKYNAVMTSVWHFLQAETSTRVEMASLEFMAVVLTTLLIATNSLLLEMMTEVAQGSSNNAK